MMRRVSAAVVVVCLAGTAMVFGPGLAQSISSLSSATHSPYARHKDASPAVIARVQALMHQGNQIEKQASELMEAGDLVGAERTCKQAITFYLTPELGDTGPWLAMRPRQLLGDIYLKGGKFQKALETYAIVGKATHGQGVMIGPNLNLNLALAYCGLGDYATARRYYSDKAITRYGFGGQKIDPADLPGTDSPATLHASILLARAMNSTSDNRAEELADYQAAEKLAPDNPLISYEYGFTLNALNRFAEAAPRLQSAASRAHGKISGAARRELTRSRSAQDFLAKHPDYLAQHPEEAPRVR